jgi:hypothetical protein
VQHASKMATQSPNVATVTTSVTYRYQPQEDYTHNMLIVQTVARSKTHARIRKSKPEVLKDIGAQQCSVTVYSVLYQ